MRVGEATGLERGLGLVERRVLDELLVVRFLPDAVVHLDHLDIADLELGDVLGRLLRKGRREELQWSVEPERGTGRRRRDHEATTRDAVHECHSLESAQFG